MTSLSGLGLGCGFGPLAAARWLPAAWGALRLVHYIASDVLTALGNITTWVDQSPNTNDAFQGVAAQQVALVTSAALNNRPAGRFTGLVQGYGALANVVSTGTNHGWWIVHDATLFAASMWLAESQAGRFGLIQRGAPTEAGVYTTGFNNAGPGTQSNGATSEVTSVAGAAYQLFRSSVLIGGAVCVATALGNFFSLGRAFTGASTCRTDIAEFVLMDQTPTAQNRANWFGYTLAEYLI